MPPVERRHLQDRERERSDYTQALQPITTSQSTKILKELAPQLLHPRILTSPAFLNGPSSSSTSSSTSISSNSRSKASDILNLSNPRNAFIALARLSGASSSSNTMNLISKASSSSSISSNGSGNAMVLRGGMNGRAANQVLKQSKVITSTDLRIIEDVDRLLNLPIPSSSSRSNTVSRSGAGGLATLQEDEEEEDDDEDKVDLLQGFNATIPSARGRKLARRRRRAILSEKQLGITIGVNELGLKERGAVATQQGREAKRLSSLASDGGQYVVESIESTPKKRVIKSKRRSSFMPTPLRDTSRHSSLHPTDASTLSQSTIAEEPSSPSQRKANLATQEGLGEEEEELLTKPELEQELSEIKLDKKSLNTRRKLTMKDLAILEEKIRKLEGLKDELGQRLLELKEEELELDDELEGVQDRLAQLEARQAGRVISSTSSRRRKGPAFLPSEHDALPPNVAFMTLTPRNSSIISSCSVTSLDFSEPYGLLVASYSLPSTSAYTSSSSVGNGTDGHSGGMRNGQVSVFDLTDGEELARLEGHSGIVKALLVEGDMAISGGEDGKIALWDLTKAIEDGLPEESTSINASHHDDDNDDNTAMNSGRNASKSNYVGAGSEIDEEEDVFFSSSKPSSVSGRRNGPNGATSHHSDEDDNDDFPLLPSPKPMHPPSSSTSYNDNEPNEPTPSAARLKLLEGHSKAVTCLSYENTSLVSGSSDKTLRLWDLNTGQCVVTMDILWAISNPLPVDADIEEQVMPSSMSGSVKTDMSQSMSNLPTSPAQYAQDSDYPWNAASSPAYMTPRTKKTSLHGLRRLSSQAYGLSLSSLAGSLPNSPSTPTAQMANLDFTQATPPYADGSWEMYSDFVGGLQLWSYALASGSADGCVRMWDTRTGQSVRSLIGHTKAVTCLQFDNLHLVSGSIDKTVRVWDLRTGRTIETLRYDGPVTSLQFDSRRIMVAGGTNNVQVFNRTTLQQTELVINGHTSPVERLRFMDRYLATGARDSTVKIWSLN